MTKMTQDNWRTAYAQIIANCRNRCSQLQQKKALDTKDVAEYCKYGERANQDYIKAGDDIRSVGWVPHVQARIGQDMSFYQQQCNAAGEQLTDLASAKEAASRKRRVVIGVSIAFLLLLIILAIVIYRTVV